MSKTFYYLNNTTNVLVVALAAVLIGLLAYGMFFQSSSRLKEAELLRMGQDFSGPEEIDFGESSNTILIADVS